MNKREAKELAQSGTVTIGDLRDLIAGARGRGGTSRVNPQFDLETILDIYEGSIAGRPDNERPVVMREQPFKKRPVATRDFLKIQNILRDCG